MSRGTTFLAAVAVVLTTMGLGVVAAPTASADEIWYQAVGRPTAASACPTDSAADVAAGWTAWSGSWEQWANGGRGGYVCQRSIVWAKSSPAGSGAQTPIGCQQFADGLWIDFGVDPAVPGGSTIWTDADCTTAWETVNYWAVYAPDGPDQATARCYAVAPSWGGTLENYGYPVFGCVGAI
jgi:hypothetical protein